MNDLKSRIACGKNKVFGVTEEGIILVTGVEEGAVTPISHWTDIAAISVGGQVVGLKKDGTVMVSGDNRDGQGDTDSWTDVIAVAAGSWHTVGLKSDGTVVAAGSNREGQCNVESWRDVIAVAAGPNCSVGVKADGTVLYAGDSRLAQAVSQWTDVTEVATYDCVRPFVAGLHCDGRVSATPEILNLFQNGRSREELQFHKKKTVCNRVKIFHIFTAVLSVLFKVVISSVSNTPKLAPTKWEKELKVSSSF